MRTVVADEAEAALRAISTTGSADRKHAQITARACDYPPAEFFVLSSTSTLTSSFLDTSTCATGESMRLIWICHGSAAADEYIRNLGSAV